MYIKNSYEVIMLKFIQKYDLVVTFIRSLSILVSVGQLNPWRYSPEEPKPTEAVGAR